MKVRAGFVSNSSSSSFVIFGKIFGREDLQEYFKFTDDEMDGIDDNGLYDYMEDSELNYEEIGDDEYVIGLTLEGTSDNVCSIMEKVKSMFGDDCRVYRGVNQDGEIIEFEGGEGEENEDP